MRVVAITLALLAALSTSARAQAPSSEAPVVAAASDLQFALTEVAEVFKRGTGQDVKLTFGSVRQLRPADPPRRTVPDVLLGR